MSIAKLPVTPELLLMVLGLPRDTRIMGASCEYPYRIIEFIVSHPDIPEGSSEVVPEIRAYYAEGCNHQERIEMVDWRARI